MNPVVAVLMKDPADAKTRLAPVLGNDVREELALLLFKSTINFFQRFHADKRVAVITPSSRVVELCKLLGVEYVVDDREGDINAAADRAAKWALSIGAPTILVIHADIPVLAANEIQALIAAGDQHAVVIGESRDGGTNAIVVSPPDAMPFCFGPRSARAHEEMAIAAGLSSRRMKLHSLARDIDNPGDLLVLPEGTRSGLESFSAFVLPNLPEIQVGDDLSMLILEAASSVDVKLRPGDIVVIAQKVVSKSEGRMVSLASYEPSAEAQKISEDIGKDPRKVEAILRESTHVLRARRQPPDGLLITRHRSGWICANAGIDESNLGEGKEGMLLLLPEDADASASRIRRKLEETVNGTIGVIVTDTYGRPWRHGLVNVAIGVAALPAIIDWSGRTDAYGRGLKATLPAFVDEVAAAAGTLMKKDTGNPVVIVRGLGWTEDASANSRDLLRPMSQELFL